MTHFKFNSKWPPLKIVNGCSQPVHPNPSPSDPQPFVFVGPDVGSSTGMYSAQTGPPHCLLSFRPTRDLFPSPESGGINRPCPPHRGTTLKFEMLLHPSDKSGRIPNYNYATLWSPPLGRPSLLLYLPLSSCFFSILASLLIRTPTRSVSFN